MKLMTLKNRMPKGEKKPKASESLQIELDRENVMDIFDSDPCKKRAEEAQTVWEEALHCEDHREKLYLLRADSTSGDTFHSCKKKHRMDFRFYLRARLAEREDKRFTFWTEIENPGILRWKKENWEKIKA